MGAAGAGDPGRPIGVEDRAVGAAGTTVAPLGAGPSRPGPVGGGLAGSGDRKEGEGEGER